MLQGDIVDLLADSLPPEAETGILSRHAAGARRDGLRILHHGMARESERRAMARDGQDRAGVVDRRPATHARAAVRAVPVTSLGLAATHLATVLGVTATVILRAKVYAVLTRNLGDLETFARHVQAWVDRRA